MKNLENAALGDALSLAKEIALGVYDTVSGKISPQEALTQAGSVVESAVGLISHTLGTALDIFNLVVVPEVAR